MSLEGVYDPATDGIVSSYYQIDRKSSFLRGIVPGTTIEQLKAVCLPGDLSVSGKKLATGTRLELADKSLTVIVTGDLNGDGVATITDMLKVKTFLLGKKLSDTELAAGDINYDGNVTITDFLRIKSFLLGMDNIEAGWQKNYTAENTLLLLTPGQTTSWKDAPASYISADKTRVTVAEDGTIKALKTGTTYIYAVKDNQVIAKMLVTIVDEPVKLTLGQSESRLIAGNTMNLTARKNHPVPMKITWTSSDTKVATVDENGAVKALKPGKVCITASLPNGSQAQVEIAVAPPITAVNTDRTLYKVKPGATKQLSLNLTPAGVEEVFTWTSSDPSVAKVNADGVVTGVKNGTVTITAKGNYSGLSATCQVKVCNVKQVAITFDDGPGPYTKKLLDFLKEQDIRVSFFLQGSRINSYTSVVKQMAADGHEIGYHSYDHKEQTRLSNDQIISEYKTSEKILKSVCGQSFTLWRTPGGGYSARVLSCVPLPHIMWSVDTYDWKTLNANSVYSQIFRYTKDGSIVLMHDIHNSTVVGAMSALKEMQAGDYEFVTVTELLNRDGTPPEAGKTYYDG